MYNLNKNRDWTVTASLRIARPVSGDAQKKLAGSRRQWRLHQTQLTFRLHCYKSLMDSALPIKTLPVKVSGVKWIKSFYEIFTIEMTKNQTNVICWPENHVDHTQLISGQGNAPGLSSGNPLGELAIVEQRPDKIHQRFGEHINDSVKQVWKDYATKQTITISKCVLPHVQAAHDNPCFATVL